jgi:shikimate kinase
MIRENIFLIGFMGAGKSTIARTLKHTYGMKLIEMDEQIEQEQGRSISDIFAAEGEEYFRGLETQLLESLQHKKNTVVSCGGGVPMRACNVEAMKKSGIIVYLSATAQTVYQRVRFSHNRPLLEGNMNVAYIQQLMDQRLPHYLAAADFTVTVDDKEADGVCREILNVCQKNHR